jgi:hypothetical protein
MGSDPSDPAICIVGVAQRSGDFASNRWIKIKAIGTPMTPVWTNHYRYPSKRALLANSVAFFLFAVIPILRHFYKQGSGSYGSYPVTVAQYLLLGSAVFLLPYLYQNRAFLAPRRICTCLSAYVLLYLLISYAGIEMHPLLYAEKYSEWKMDFIVFPFAVCYFIFGVFYGAYKDNNFVSGAFFLQLIFVLIVIGMPQVLSSTSISDSDDKVDYQYWGDAFAFLAIMYVTTRRAPTATLVSAFLTVVALFLIPSRSSLICGTFALAVFMFMRFPSAVLMTGSFIAGFFVFFFIGMRTNVDVAEFIQGHAFSRQTYFLAEGGDNSLNLRLEYSATAWKTISENPFLGQYGYYLEKYSEPGTYMHNVVDIWAEAGMVPFLIFSLFIFMSARYVYSKKDWISYNPRLTGISMLVFSIVSLLLARNQGAIHIIFGIGAGVGAAVLKKYVSAVNTAPLVMFKQPVTP